MPKAGGLKLTATWESPPVKPLDEVGGQAWKAKGRAQERQDRESRMTALTWGSIVALLAVAGELSLLSTYEIQIRCVLVAAAAGMMFQGFNTLTLRNLKAASLD